MYFIDRRLNPKGKSVINRQRFLRRARDEIRQGVKEAVNNGKVADISAGGKISIPSKGLHEPRFVYDPTKGVSDRVFPGNKTFVEDDKITRPPTGAGAGGKGPDASEDGEGEDDFRFTLTREEFLDIFFEDLALPDLVKKELKELLEFENRRAGIVKTGAPANMDLRRTMRHSLTRRIGLKRPRLKAIEDLERELETLRSRASLDDKEQRRIAEIEVDLKTFRRRRRIIPYIDPTDVRFRSFNKIPLPNTRAVMFCLMDVSGSMSEEKKDLAKRFFMLLHLFLIRRYKRVEIIFIRHTSQASEVDEETFFYSTETGGTIVSTALEEMRKIVDDRYPRSTWNIYAAQASDGDTFGQDQEVCVAMLRESIMPACQYFAYIEVMEEHEEALFKDESNATKLWRAYSDVCEEHSNFAMRRASRPPDIFPIFRELFTTEKEG